MVSKHTNFSADVTATQTLWLWFGTRKGTSSAASLRWSGNRGCEMERTKPPAISRSGIFLCSIVAVDKYSICAWT
jgi:hypothetical protein